MAIRTQVTVVDDLDESTANVSTVQFAVQGVEYEIDLAPHNLAMLHAALAPFTTAGRRVPANRRTRGTKTRTGSNTRGRAGDATPAAVRRWWATNPQPGTDLPRYRANGPIPQSVYQAYRDAR